MSKKTSLIEQAKALGLEFDYDNESSFTIADLEKAITEAVANKPDEAPESQDEAPESQDEETSPPEEPVVTKSKAVKEEDVPFVVKFRESEKKLRKLTAEFNDFKKNSVAIEKYNELKTNFAAKEKACSDLRKQIVQLNAQD